MLCTQTAGGGAPDPAAARTIAAGDGLAAGAAGAAAGTASATGLLLRTAAPVASRPTPLGLPGRAPSMRPAGPLPRRPAAAAVEGRSFAAPFAPPAAAGGGLSPPRFAPAPLSVDFVASSILPRAALRLIFSFTISSMRLSSMFVRRVSACALPETQCVCHCARARARRG